MTKRQPKETQETRDRARRKEQETAIRRALIHSTRDDLSEQARLVRDLTIAEKFASGAPIDDIASSFPDMSDERVIEAIRGEFQRLWWDERNRVRKARRR